MVNFPLKTLTYFLQIRTLASNSSSKLTESSQVLKSKTRQDNKVSVIDFLKEYQFSDTHISKLVHKCPTIFRCNDKSTLEPKIKFLVENGFKGSLLIELVVKNPLILRRNLNDHLIPNLEYLRYLLRYDHNTVSDVINKASWMLSSDLTKILQPNIDLLSKEGVAMSNVIKLLTTQPRSLRCSVDRLGYGVETVKNFGLKPSDNMFMFALRVVLSFTGSNWKKKLHFFTSLGWCDQDIGYMIANYPLCFAHSEENLKKTFDYFVQTMDIDPKYLIAHPSMLTFSLHRRIIPRCNVVKRLKEEKLVEEFSLESIINMSEEEFTRGFILKHPTLSSDLWNIYRGNQKVDSMAVKQ